MIFDINKCPTLAKFANQKDEKGADIPTVVSDEHGWVIQHNGKLVEFEYLRITNTKDFSITSRHLLAICEDGREVEINSDYWDNVLKMEDKWSLLTATKYLLNKLS